MQASPSNPYCLNRRTRLILALFVIVPLLALSILESADAKAMTRYAQEQCVGSTRPGQACHIDNFTLKFDKHGDAYVRYDSAGKCGSFRINYPGTKITYRSGRYRRVLTEFGERTRGCVRTANIRFAEFLPAQAAA